MLSKYNPKEHPVEELWDRRAFILFLMALVLKQGRIAEISALQLHLKEGGRGIMSVAV